jgi:hypothetical protein
VNVTPKTWLCRIAKSGEGSLVLTIAYQGNCLPRSELQPNISNEKSASVRRFVIRRFWSDEIRPRHSSSDIRISVRIGIGVRTYRLSPICGRGTADGWLGRGVGLAVGRVGCGWAVGG